MIGMIGAAVLAAESLFCAGCGNRAAFYAKPGDDLVAKVDEVRRARGGKPAVLWLKGGTYRVKDTIRLDRRDSNLLIAAMPGERPVLDAGYAVRCFRPAGDGTSVADVSDAPFIDAKIRGYGGIGVLRDDGFTDDLYRDGVLQTLAREPNAGFFKVTEVVDGSNFVFRSAAVDAAKFADEKDLLALGYWRYLWGDETYPASVKDGAWALDHSNAEYRPVVKDAPFFLLNSRKFLDRDDEWVLDRAARKVYVKGEPKGEYVLAGLRGPLLQADGASGLTVSGLTFRHGRGTGVMVRNCSDFTFTDNVVERFGFNGLDCQCATRARIVRNRFRTFGWKAALLCGGDRATLAPSGCEFADNDVTDTGRSRRTYSHGILISGCGVSVVRNRFHDLPSSAMCTPGNDHFIASNVIERVVLESDDQGGLDVFGNPFFRGTRIVHNVWRDIGGASTGLAGTCGKAGVRLDDMISGMYVYGNRFDNCSEGVFGGVQIHAGRDNTIDNNVFTRCRHALSVTVWSKERWQRSWDSNDPIRETVDTCSPEWIRRYGDLRWLRDYPITNRFTRNVVIGAKTLMRGQAEWETVKDGTRVFPADAKVDLDHLEGFDPLPPEGELGPRVGTDFEFAVTPEFYYDRVRVDLPVFSNAQVKAVATWAGTCVATGVQAKVGRPVYVKLPHPFHAWSPKTPQLYGVTVSVTTADGRTETAKAAVGMRTVGFRRESDGLEHLAINDHAVQLKPGSDGWVRAEGLRDAAFYDACDRKGTLVVQALPDDETAAKGIFDAVRNHPSVICWEVASADSSAGRALAKWDATRPQIRPGDTRLALALPPRIASEPHILWKSGDDGVAIYRIPALVTAPNGDLVAVADARKTGIPDLHYGNPIWTVVRRSSDGGKTWTKTEKAWDWPWTDAEKTSASDPSLLVDSVAKKVFLFYNTMEFAKGPDVYRFWVQESSDNGKTWSRPREISNDIARPEWPCGKSHRRDKAGIFIPSGSGTQLKDGTLLHTFTWASKGQVALFGSPDHGRTWKPYGKPVRAGNECKVVELADGSLMVNSRYYAAKRYVTVSKDRGETWTGRWDDALVDPMCNAQLMRVGRHLVFSNCRSIFRRNLFVRASADEGRTWNEGVCISPDGAGYSDITVLPNGDLGVLYEGVDYETIEFVTLPMKAVCGEDPEAL